MKLRFSIRDLLWLTLLVAMSVAWTIDRNGVAKQLKIESEALTRANKRVQDLETERNQLDSVIRKLQKKLGIFTK
jgi:hypothetical protein